MRERGNFDILSGPKPPPDASEAEWAKYQDDLLDAQLEAIGSQEED